MGRALICLLILLAASLAGVVYSKEWMEWLLPARYGEGSKEVTSTKYYSRTRAEINASTYVPCFKDCPWQRYESNEAFKANEDYKRPFDIDDDHYLFSMKGQLACVPSSFGYSLQEGLHIFPPYEYPLCQSKAHQPQAKIILDVNASVLNITCKDYVLIEYVIHPPSLPPTHELLQSSMNSLLTSTFYFGNPFLNIASEYVFASCFKIFNSAVHIPIFQAEAYSKVLKAMEKQAKNKPVRPMTILFLTVDSFSRRHFYRKMPKTVRLLSEWNKNETYMVTDFKLHNICGEGSAENMIPVFTNKTLKMKEEPEEEDQSGKGALWRVLGGLGFMTLLGFEDCDHYFPVYLGRVLKVDHLIRSFYCAASQYCGLRYDIGPSLQRCIGSHMSHYYALNYTQEFMRIYPDANQFAYLHLNAAHEASGQHAATLDADLEEFLRGVVEEFGERRDLVVFVQGDHGMRYGNWKYSFDAEQEHKLPVLFLIAPTQLLDRVERSYDSLHYNSFRLVGKKDLRATILDLAALPYNQSYPVHSDPYLSNSNVLFREKIEDSRTCKTIGIRPWLCSCLFAVSEIPVKVIHSWGRSSIEELIDRIVEESLFQVNRLHYTSTLLPPDLLCQRLTFDSILHAYGTNVSLRLEVLEVIFTVKESDSARIKAVALVGTDRGDEYMQLGREVEPLERVEYLGFPAFVRVKGRQIISVTRKDAYAGVCEEIARTRGVDAEFCICPDLDTLNETYPQVYNH